MLVSIQKLHGEAHRICRVMPGVVIAIQAVAKPALRLAVVIDLLENEPKIAVAGDSQQRGGSTLTACNDVPRLALDIDSRNLDLCTSGLPSPANAASQQRNGQFFSKQHVSVR
ncbi:MAG: hypothetical protein WCQ16_03895 [Verrucomicrobiae bacterium]